MYLSLSLSVSLSFSVSPSVSCPGPLLGSFASLDLTHPWAGPCLMQYCVASAPRSPAPPRTPLHMMLLIYIYIYLYAPIRAWPMRAQKDPQRQGPQGPRGPQHLRSCQRPRGPQHLRSCRKGNPAIIR